jgi:formate dehydrogenase maturation protein FdhE
MAKAPELFLLKLFNTGKFSVIAWSPIQAKKGYTVMTIEQAQPYLKLAKMGKNHVDNVKNKDFIKSIKKIFEVSGKAGRALAEKVEAQRVEDLENADDSNTKSIVKKVVKDNVKKQMIDDGETRELSVSQEAIQIKEAKYVKGLQHKSTLESHMLEKYQCEIPSGRLEAMKALANSMLSDLAKDNRLYLVDGQVVAN